MCKNIAIVVPTTEEELPNWVQEVGRKIFSNWEHIDLKQKLHFLKQVEGMAELKELRLKVIFIENENFYRKGNHCKLQLKTENLYNLKVQNYNWNWVQLR